MPLLDHFHEPLHPARNWRSFFRIWCAALVGQLNLQVLPPKFFAEIHVRFGRRGEPEAEIDAFSPPDQVMSAVFSDVAGVHVFGERGGLQLVAAIELVCPRSKDSPEARRMFVSRCAAYLNSGVGLLLVDVVTDRTANLHNELIDLLLQDQACGFASDTGLYAVAYRPERRESEGHQIAIWTETLTLGQPLPTMPLAVRGSAMVPVDLESTYTQARSGSRL